MEFTRFQSLLNENPKNYLEVLEKYQDCQAIMTEKLHGANFSFYINWKGETRFASRNQYLCQDGNFFQSRRYFTDEVINIAVYNISPLLEGGETIRFIGELFGGHDAVGVKPVQREVRYDGDIQFRVFHVEFIKGDVIMHSNWPEVISLANTAQLPIVPVIAEDTLKNLYMKSVETPSVLASNGDTAEGYCYRLRENVGFEPIILKRRSANFLETKGTLKGEIFQKEYDPDVLEILNKVKAMVTPQRVSNVNSHHGFNGLPCFAHLHKAVMDDIEKDALSDYGLDASAFKVIRKDIGFTLRDLVKIELTK